MKAKKIFYNTMILLSSYGLFVACNQEPAPVPETDLAMAKDLDFGAQISDEIYTTVDFAIEAGLAQVENDNKSFIDTACGSISIFPADSTTWPKVITIDYGPVNCLGSDGNYRRGAIEIEVSGPPFLPGTTNETSFTDFYFNDNHIEGFVLRTNATLNTNNNPVFTLQENLTITKPDSTQIIRTASKEREWVTGTATPQYHWDDIFLITGFSSGSNSQGNGFTDTIVTPLEKAVNCQWIRSGERQITKANGTQLLLNYGNGNCDPLATITINGNTVPINLN